VNKKYFLFFSVLLISANIGLSAGPARTFTVRNKSKHPIWVQQHYKGKDPQEKIKTSDKMIMPGKSKKVSVTRVRGYSSIMWLQNGKIYRATPPYKTISIRNYGWYWKPGGIWPHKAKRFKGKTKDNLSR